MIQQHTRRRLSIRVSQSLAQCKARRHLRSLFKPVLRDVGPLAQLVDKAGLLYGCALHEARTFSMSCLTVARSSLANSLP